jgi:hypothetical protein
MTRAAGTATSIAAPATSGTYRLHVVNAQGAKLGESAALLRVTGTVSCTTPPCSILREYWNNITGTAVTNLTSNANYPNSPTGSEQLTSLEGPTNAADNYGSRIRGYIRPPASGAYTFWLASDDSGELWLSTSDNPASATRIAYVSGWTNSREWSKYTSQRSAAINLTAGQRYYIEVLHKEGTGGDNVAVAWQGPGISQAVIAGSYLSPFIPQGSGTFPVAGTYYRIINRNSGKVVDVSDNSTADGANVHQWTWLGATNQQWQFVATDSGYFQVVARHSGKVLDVAEVSTADGGNIHQWTWLGGANQQWSVNDLGNGYYSLIARHSGKALDVSGCGTADGVNIQQWAWLNNNCQQWQIVP